MKFYIKTLESWFSEATYYVEASNCGEAIKKVFEGTEAYEEHEHTGWADEMVAVLEVERIE